MKITTKNCISSILKSLFIETQFKIEFLLLFFGSRNALNITLLDDTVHWSRKWLVDFNAGKTQLVSFDWSNNTGVIDVKMDGFVIEEK